MQKHYCVSIKLSRVALILLLFSAWINKTSALAPVANFTTNKTVLTEKDSVTYTDGSTNTPTGWSWNFPGGVPSFSYIRNPVVVYPYVGRYDVTLMASNASGTSTPLVRSNYITVTPVAGNNAYIKNVASPVNFNAGTYDISLRVQNNGVNVINQLTIDWELDGVLQPQVSWFSPIDTFRSVNRFDTVITLGSATFAQGTGRSLKAWISSVNFGPDTATSGDTINVMLNTMMAGPYTIGGTSPDYPTITSALDDLLRRGAGGHVVFNIRNGTYNGKVVIPSIPGASDTSTITFQSESHDSSLVILESTAATTMGTEATVTLAGASYVNLRWLTITQNSTTASSALYINGKAVKDSILNCRTSMASSTGSYRYSIYANSATLEGLVFMNNLIQGGYYGLYLYGGAAATPARNCVVDNNDIRDVYYYSTYMYYTTNLKFRNNTIGGTTSSTTHYYVYPYYADSAYECTGNRVTASCASSYCYWVYYSRNTPGQRAIVANNVSGFTSGVTTTFTNYVYYPTNVDCYNNTFHGKTTTTTSYSTYVYTSSSYPGLSFKNNSCSNMGLGYALYVYDPAFISLDHNLYYTMGTALIYKGITTATGYSTIAQWRAAFPQHDKNSVVYRPPFLNNAAPEPDPADSASWALNGRGTFLPFSMNDFNGNIRPSTLAEGAPDIGAFEVTPTAIPPQATAVPATPVDGTTQVFLFADDTVAKINWAAFSVVPLSVTLRYYSGTNPPHASPVVTPHMNCYWDFQATGTPPFNYDLFLYYKNSMMGTIPNEHVMQAAQYNIWTQTWGNAIISTNDSAANILSASALTEMTLVSGSDPINPLPVSLTRLQANAVNKDVLVTWTTASETNLSHFIVEASADGKHFVRIGKVTAKGDANSVTGYRFTHPDAQQDMHGASAIYYRLVSTDKKGSATVSEEVKVSFDKIRTAGHITVHPNPFSGQFTLSIPSDKSAVARVEIMDLHGRIVAVSTADLVTGMNDIPVNNLGKLETGVYFIKTSVNGETQMTKVVKE